MRKSVIITAIVALIGMIGIVAITTDAEATNNGPCVTGDTRHDFVVDWNADQRSGTVRTKDNRPLCADTPLTVSTFTLPTNYDGRGWWLYDEDRLNPTVVPQTHFKTEKFVMKKGSNGNIAFKTALNPECGRWVQTDAYVGKDEIRQIVGKGGIEDRIIQGSISKNSDCPPPAPKPEPKPVVKNIEVCNLKTMKKETIKEDKFNSSQYSKNLDDCKKPEPKPEPKPVVKNIEVCNVKTKQKVTIREDKFNESTYSKNLDDCKKPEPKPEPKPVAKDIEVCNLKTKQKVTIKDNKFNESTYSKDLDDCKKAEPKPKVKNIEVCNLDDKSVEVIKENAFDKEKQSKDLNNCIKTEAPVAPLPQTPKATVVEELPQTGLISTGGLALTTIAVSAVAYIRSRR